MYIVMYTVMVIVMVLRFSCVLLMVGFIFLLHVHIYIFPAYKHMYFSSVSRA